jgi:hypothetical protein
MLSDGKVVTFEQWRDGFEDKVQANEDHFTAATEQDTQRNIVAYMRTRTEGSAHQFLSTLIRSAQKNNQPIEYSHFLDRLEKTYGDPHKRLNARTEFRNLRLRNPIEFAVFQGNFYRLANDCELPEDQWVEEFHDKLPNELRTAMGVYRRQYNGQYDTYVELARDIARELAVTGAAQQHARARTAARTPAPTPPAPNPLPKPVATTASQPIARPAASQVTCYNCQKTGHYQRDCPHSAENKAIEELDQDEKEEPGDIFYEASNISDSSENTLL